MAGIKRQVLLMLLIAIVGVGIAWAAGQNHSGTVYITNHCDTLNDTASGSGLAVYNDYVWGINFADFKNIFGKVILEASPNTAHGYGDADSAIMWLKYDNLNDWITADSCICTALPCTLSVDSTTVNWGSHVSVYVYMNDTTSDTVMTATHKIKYDITVRE